ncbi:hypothetical protein [Caballeronia sp. AZ7_KS35]|uniref:hypothetical protein n=1 Tax=Caballeronia sp. AZ7_KS35 TaxID=2921762 RepID=UPI002028A677|nr:hypothetical protein [Caballeronia sp. AZ7_KS35]
MSDPFASLNKFKPKTAAEVDAQLVDETIIEKVAAANNFPSRQAPSPVAPAKERIAKPVTVKTGGKGSSSQTASAATPSPRSLRRFKTGRNVQINVKGEQETKDELYRLADVIDAPLGETLKRALAALDREIQTSKK